MAKQRIVYINDNELFREMAKDTYLPEALPGVEVVVFSHPYKAANYLSQNPCSLLIMDNNYIREDAENDRLLDRHYEDKRVGSEYKIGAEEDLDVGIKVAGDIKNGHMYGSKLHIDNKNMVVLVQTGDPRKISISAKQLGVFETLTTSLGDKVNIDKIKEAMKEHKRRASQAL